MSYNVSKKEIQRLSDKHNIPFALMKYRCQMGFPISRLGCAEMANGDYVNTDKRPPRKITEKSLEKPLSGYTLTPNSPSQSTSLSGIKITRKRSRLKNHSMGD